MSINDKQKLQKTKFIERAVMATLTASGLDYELSATTDSKILELDKILAS